MYYDRKASQLKKHSVTLAGHRTSISIEEIYWQLLNKAAEDKGTPLSHLIEEIDNGRTCNLSSALRLFVLGWEIQKSSENNNEE